MTIFLTFLGFSVLGGHAVNLSPDDAHLGVSESIKDTSKLVFTFSDLVTFFWP